MSKQEMMNQIKAEIESVESRIEFLSFDIGNGISAEAKAEIALLAKKYQALVALAKKVMAGDFKEVKSRANNSSSIQEVQRHHNMMAFQHQQLRDLHGSW